jgi:hypothetical protein
MARLAVWRCPAQRSGVGPRARTGSMAPTSCLTASALSPVPTTPATEHPALPCARALACPFVNGQARPALLRTGVSDPGPDPVARAQDEESAAEHAHRRALPPTSSVRDQARSLLQPPCRLRVRRGACEAEELTAGGRVVQGDGRPADRLLWQAKLWRVEQAARALLDAQQGEAEGAPREPSLGDGECAPVPRAREVASVGGLERAARFCQGVR